MDVYTQYTKKRREFGAHCHLDDVKAQTMETIEPTYVYDVIKSNKTTEYCLNLFL